MFRTKLFLPLTFMGLALLVSSECYAQADVNAQQQFRVTVPSRFSVSPPSALEIINYDGTSAPDFAPQSWQVISNAPQGATLTMITDQAFTNVASPLDGSGQPNKRDVSLLLEKTAGSPTWAVTTATDATDYAGSNETATVVAESNRAGAAFFDLTVSMIDPDFDDLAAGDYEMTITGTLSAK